MMEGEFAAYSMKQSVLVEQVIRRANLLAEDVDALSSHNVKYASQLPRAAVSLYAEAAAIATLLKDLVESGDERA